MTSAQQRREGVRFLQRRGISQRRGCALLHLARSSCRTPVRSDPNQELRQSLHRIGIQHPCYGYRRAWALLRRGQESLNRKRIHRLWKEERLTLARRKPRKRNHPVTPYPLQATSPYHVWTYDFLFDRTREGRSVKILTIVDEFSKEALAIRVGRSLPAAAVVETIQGLFRSHGTPRYLRSDNGPEFIARRMQLFLSTQQVQTKYIAPGCPWQNAYGESFNEKLRTECLNREIFASLAEAQWLVECWRRQYNQDRPHSSLDYLTPHEFLLQWNLNHPGRKQPLPAVEILRSSGYTSGQICSD